MSDERINLSDPDFEPTDEQLQGLMHRAFAGVREAHQESLRRLREEIARLREEVVRSLDQPRDGR